MSASKWVVTTAAERVNLDPTKRGETTFTVTNPGKAADRVVFEIVPGDGADPAWFSVEDPQRRVPGTASVSYLLKLALPPDAPPGSYQVQGRVYSADDSPEDSSVLSSRVLFDVAAPPAAQRKRVPWWVFVVAALLVLTLGVVGWLVTRGDDPVAAPEPVATLSPTPPSGPIAVPNLSKLKEEQAAFELRQAGLKMGKVKHKHDPVRAEAVLEQSIAPGVTVARDTPVDLVIAVRLTAPTPKSLDSATAGAGTAITWTQAEPYVTQWRVEINVETCAGTVCGGVPMVLDVVDRPSFRVPLAGPRSGGGGLFTTGVIQWRIVTVDDFGVLAAASPWLVTKVK